MSDYFEYHEWESDGRFGLSQQRTSYAPGDDSLGRGSAPMVMSFLSAKGRTYYKQAADAREAARIAQWRYDSLIAELARLVKRRNIRKRLTELIG